MLFPELQPFASGMLNVGQGHSVYWEQCGTPGAQPVLFLHGGPGAGCSERARRLFSPQRWCVTLFDQRGCGRSTPHASTHANDTEHLLADIEKLRESLGIERWVLVGGSWGCTLALAYAQRHRARVQGIVLRSVFTGRQQEQDWLYGPDGAAKIFPQDWQEFEALAAAQNRSAHLPGSLLAPYAAALSSSEAALQTRAALAWCQWESAVSSFDAQAPSMQPNAHHCLAMACISAHIFSTDKTLTQRGFIWPVDYLNGVPGIIVQGRYDMCTPVTTAWELHQQWPGSILRILNEAGHSSSEPVLQKSLLAAIEEMETLCH